MKIKYTFWLSIAFLTFLLWACSQESNSLVSKAYHNTTAYYNAYFLADEQMKLIDLKIRKNHKDDYNRILPVFEVLDTTFNNSLKKELDYVGEKSSFPVQFHKNSDWVDDCYILLGKVRLYQNKPDLAIQTFRYVNYKSTDEPTRHRALYWLMRIYLIDKQYSQAQDVFRYLSSQELSPKNKKEYHLAMAFYHQHFKEYNDMLTHVELAIPNIKGDKDLKARTNFIAGQLHQQFGHDSLAYVYYENALKGTPPYELTFFTKLNMAQVSSVEDKAEVKKITKYFTKLLNDLKNQEYKDRIYYEMARFDLKQGNIDSAFADINRSIKAKSTNPYQKGYTYWLAGKTRFKQKKYVQAQAYYDSTFANIPKDFPEYTQIEERKEILVNFVKHYKVVQTQDSLQRLAKMDSVELSAYLDKVVAEEEIRLKKQMEAKKLEDKKKKDEENSKPIIANQNSNFIFYNEIAFAKDNMKFVQRWGTRTLEDDWRRSNRQKEFKEEVVDTLAVQKEIEKEAKKKAEKEKENEEIVIKVDKNKYYQDIPFTEKALAASNEKKKHALYQLGKSYDLQLQEYLDAIDAFKRLQKEFPDSEYEAETAYFLYLLCAKTGKCTTDEHKQLLLTKYPNSIYAKKVINPNYAQDNESTNRASHDLYEQAYLAFVKGKYFQTQKQLESLLAEYPNTDIKDKVVFLKILTYAKLEQFGEYQTQLIQFQEDFKTSKLVEEAKNLLVYLADKKGKIQDVPTTYQVCSDSTKHYFVAILSYKESNKEQMMDFFKEFAETYYPTEKFEQRPVAFSEESYIITIQSFPNKSFMKEYLKKLAHFAEFKGTLKDKPHQYLFFSEQNYQVFIHNKKVDEYLKFYKANY